MSRRLRTFVAKNADQLAELRTFVANRAYEIRGGRPKLPTASAQMVEAVTVSDDQWLTETRAWISAGGTYKVRPGIAPAVVLCALSLFFPALVILLGLAFSDLFLVFAAAVIALVPVGAIVFLIFYRRAACLYVDSREIGRIGFRGRIVARCPRTQLGAVGVHKGSYEAWIGDSIHPHGTWDDNVMYVLDRRGSVAFRVTLHVWTLRQVELLSRLAQ